MAGEKKSFWGIAAAIATVIATAWAVFTYWVPGKEKKKDPEISQQAGPNSVNVGTTEGGDVTINQQKPDIFIRPESSDSARLTLAILGGTWSAESFIGAIVDGNLRFVELFLIGGMSQQINYKGANPIVYCLHPQATNRLEVCKLFVKYNFDPNQNLTDTRIMPQQEGLPPHFDNELTPEGYGAWNHTFVGPADLWITIRASASGPAPGDFELQDFLFTNGATFKVSYAFLKDYESIYGSTPVYWDVRNKVETLMNLPVTKRPKTL